jgi:hypothetical protein
LIALFFVEVSPMPDDPDEQMRPWVQVAAFVNVAMNEGPPGGWISLIRILDRWFFNGTTPEMPPSVLQTTLVVMFKSGNMKSQATVKIRPVSPSKKELPSIEIPVLFEGDERGVTIVLPVVMQIQESGLYWFDVLVDEQIFTRIPLRVVYQKAPGMTGTPPAGPQKPEA